MKRALRRLATAAGAQGYQPREMVTQFDMGQPVNRYSNANGLPGLDYRRNRADYESREALDLKTPKIAGIATITYANNRPDTFDVL
ncbi:hypothetical protein [uncultured Sphingomonas sp.]|uniref:hypothetical protein n=1 Tax=uncultured Sphingomonas sp. TaxID=158754 RepID=UPI003747C43E